MKIIFLNLWHGELEKALRAFVQEQKKDTDIFCFQEADHSLGSSLPDYEIVRAEKSVENGLSFFQETDSRPEAILLSSQVLLKDQAGVGVALYTEVQFQKQKIHLLNVHGHFVPIEKRDSPERLLQSQTLIDFLEEKEGIKIIGGDFNILPDQKSIRMFEENGYRDLIKDFHIPTTRNKFAWKNHPTKFYYSDYVFVSPEVKVKNFSVPDLEISDHLPLILETE